MLRAAALAGAVALGTGQAAASPPNVIVAAEYSEPTTRYDHGILGDAVEWGALVLTADTCFGCETRMMRKFIIRLPENRVFEDVAPRIVDLDGDESPEVIVVESDLQKGARLAVYYEGGLLAATPFIGRRYRWLAPLGAADLDGDGRVEIAYVDRPHLAKVLRIWRYADGVLEPVAEAPGFSNHRIGESEISGGIRECGNGPEMVLASGDWQSVMAVRLHQGRLSANRLTDFEGPTSLVDALHCTN